MEFKNKTKKREEEEVDYKKINEKRRGRSRIEERKYT